MKFLLTPLFIALLSCATFAQNSVPFIEIAVDETVELKVENIVIQLFVRSEYDQREEATYAEFGYFDMYEYWEEDYEYETLLRDSPKKITKEMRQAYEERQKEQEERQLAREEFARNYVPYTIEDLEQTLKDNGVAYTVVDNQGEYGLYEEYDGYYDYGYGNALEIKASSKEEYEKINEIIEFKPVYNRLTGATFETLDKIYLEAIPKLTEKAKAQGNALALSLDRKLGKVLQCTNIYPYTPSIRSEYGLYDEYDNYYDLEDYENPFVYTKKEFIQFVYRFELL